MYDRFKGWVRDRHARGMLHSRYMSTGDTVTVDTPCVAVFIPGPAPRIEDILDMRWAYFVYGLLAALQLGVGWGAYWLDAGTLWSAIQSTLMAALFIGMAVFVARRVREARIAEIRKMLLDAAGGV